MGVTDLTGIAYQVVSDLLGVVTSSFDVDATAQHQAAGLVLAGLVEAQRLISCSQARQLAREWQEVISTLAVDAAESLEVVTELELKEKGHPYFWGKIAVLRTLTGMADEDAERFKASTYPVEVELLRAQLAASQAQLAVLLVMLCGQQFTPDALQAVSDRWWGAHQMAVALEQKLVKA